jgi:hypothetical protein
MSIAEYNITGLLSLTKRGPIIPTAQDEALMASNLTDATDASQPREAVRRL